MRRGSGRLAETRSSDNHGPNAGDDCKEVRTGTLATGGTTAVDNKQTNINDCRYTQMQHMISDMQPDHVALMFTSAEPGKSLYCNRSEVLEGNAQAITFILAKLITHVPGVVDSWLKACIILINKSYFIIFYK